MSLRQVCMNCDYYDGDISKYITCLHSRKELCDKFCKVKGENRLRKYSSLAKKPIPGNFKDTFYDEEKVCFVCGSTIDESIEHLYPQSELKKLPKIAFLESCPSNFRRACTACNSHRENEWSPFVDDKRKVHQVLQEYRIEDDENITFCFNTSTFDFNQENIYSQLYLEHRAIKKFNKLYELDYELGFLKWDDIVQMENANELAYYKILKNTIKKIRER